MIQSNAPSFTLLPYPRSRRLVIDAMHAGRRKHMIHGLVEFDVTRPRALLRDAPASRCRSLLSCSTASARPWPRTG